MKAEMAVRSISASISAWAARMAPRTISRVTGSQVVGCGRGASARGAGRSFSIERSIRTVLDEQQRRDADEGGKDDEEGRRDRAAGLADQVGRHEGSKAAEDGDGQAIADRQAGEAHLGRKELG